MIQRLLFFLFIFLSFSVYSQIEGPPPCGINPVYVCDDNDDGFKELNLRDLFPFTSFCTNSGEVEEDYHQISYYETEDDMNNEINAITNPEIYTNISNPQTIYFRANAMNPGGSSEYLISIDDFVEVRRLLVDIPSLVVYDNDSDGIATFDLTSVDIFCGTNDKNDYTVTYHESQIDVTNGTNAIPNPSSFINKTNGDYIYVRAEHNSSSYVEATSYFYLRVLFAEANLIPNIVSCGSFDLTGLNATVLGNQSPDNFTVTYHLSQNDADNNTNTLPSIYDTSGSVFIYSRVEENTKGSYATTSFVITFEPEIVIEQPSALMVCDGDDSPDGFAIIDLTQKDDEITNGQSNLIVSYHSSPADANTGTNPIPSLYVNTNTPTDVVYVRVINSLTGCFNSTTTLSVNIIVGPIVNRDTQYLNACDRDLDGMATFDLTQVLNDILMGLTGVTPTFHESYADANAGTNPIANTTNYQNTKLKEQSIYVRIEDNTTGCASIVPLEIHTNLLLTGTDLGDFALCDTNDDDSDILEFNLTSVENSISNDLPNPVAVTFYETEADRDSSTNPIPKGVLYSAISPKVLYVDLDDGICPEVGEITLLVHPILLFNPADPIPYCDIDGDGIANIDLHSLDDIVTGGNVEFTVSYFSTNIDADNNTNQLPLVYTNTSSLETIYARVGSNLSGCASVNSFDIIVQDCRDQDNDGVINEDEDINGNGNLEDDDTDGDTIPNYMDDDDDGDKIDTADELIDQSNISGKSRKNFKGLSGVVIDTDNDTIENYLDNDDDGDGILTKDEDYNNNGTPLDDDTNSNSVPDYLESSVALGVNDTRKFEFVIYPNPTSNFAVLNFNKNLNNNIKIRIYNIQGKQIINSMKALKSTSLKLDVSGLSKGMYFIKLDDGNSRITKKLLVN